MDYLWSERERNVHILNLFHDFAKFDTFVCRKENGRTLLRYERRFTALCGRRETTQIHNASKGIEPSKRLRGGTGNQTIGYYELNISGVLQMRQIILFEYLGVKCLGWPTQFSEMTGRSNSTTQERKGSVSVVLNSHLHLHPHLFTIGLFHCVSIKPVLFVLHRIERIIPGSPGVSFNIPLRLLPSISIFVPWPQPTTHLHLFEESSTHPPLPYSIWNADCTQKREIFLQWGPLSSSS